jgi:hypothetical protein
LGPDNADPQLYVSQGYGAINFLGYQQELLTGVPFVTANTLGLPNYLIRRENKNFGPRVGFAYSLPGISNTVVRGGYGLFYQRDTDNAFVDLSLNPPFIYYTFRPFNQSNINEFNWFDPTAGGSNNALGYYCMNPYMKTPRTQQWNLSLEHTHWGALFSLGYVGSFSYHMTNLEYPNQARPGPGDIASRRRWPDWFFYWQNWNGVGNYHGLQLKFQKPFAHGFTLLSGFTWSKTMDDVGGNFVGEGERSSALQDNDNRRADYGLAAQDVPKRFVVAYLYELPVGRGKRFLSKGGAASAVLGGWQLNGVTTVQSGNPVFVSQACNRANTDAGTMRPDLVHNPNLPGGRSHGEQVAEWFDTSAFVNVCPGPEGPFSFGNAGRNIVRGPGLHDWDFGLAKQIPLPGEGRHLDFRAEFFNIFNHPIFGQPGGTAGTPQFGVISGTVVNPREIQFALKLYF